VELREGKIEPAPALAAVPQADSRREWRQPAIEVDLRNRGEQRLTLPCAAVQLSHQLVSRDSRLALRP
jgi:hypothetical protein